MPNELVNLFQDAWWWVVLVGSWLAWWVLTCVVSWCLYWAHCSPRTASRVGAVAGLFLSPALALSYVVVKQQLGASGSTLWQDVPTVLSLAFTVLAALIVPAIVLVLIWSSPPRER
ncbi:MAG: hypothetical protein H5T86_14600 [Armatimonadetes bacterium]|nr:hypothetical protein [Armatimonadota bacterium]